MESETRFAQFALKKYFIKKPWNLIGWEHFGLNLRNKIFPKYRICAGTKQIINIFLIEQIQWKLWPLFSKNLFFAHFPNFWSKKVFRAPSQNSEKPHDQISRKHSDRYQEGRIDWPYFIGSFQLPPGGYQVQLQ